MNAWDQMRSALAEARAQLVAADSVADRLADMLVGRLRKVDRDHLRQLKRELAHFNARTGKWKS